MYPGLPSLPLPPGVADLGCGGCDPYPDGNTVGPIIAPAVPWITQYRLLDAVKPGYRGGAADVDYLLEPDVIQRNERTYWHIECYALEKQMLREEARQAFSGEEDSAFQQGAMIGARPSSQLKVVISWRSARQELRMLIADIGNGIDIQVPPCTVPRAQLLVPDVDAMPSSWPAGFDLSEQVTATVVSARATPLSSGFTPFNGRYTQTFLAVDTSPIYHQIPAFARSVTIYETAVADPPASPGVASTAGFAFDRIAPAGAYIPIGSGPVPGQINHYEIPQNAKFLTLTPGGANRLITAVYRLSL